MKTTTRACLYSLLTMAFVSNGSNAHDVITTPVTFSREISRLLYRRCTPCHRDGGAAFSLVTYAQARPWAKAIKEEVLERRMPPWGAVEGFGEFRNDEALTQEQLQLIADWVEGGAPEGNPKELPKPSETRPSGATRSDHEGIVVDGVLTLKTRMVLTGVQPYKISEGVSLRAVVEHPDGAVEPLLWIYQHRSKFAHPYWFERPLILAAGTKIKVTSREGGGIALLTNSPVR